MSLNLGDIAPNFTADTTHGMINFYEWMNSSWTILLSHPKDFTPVCTTEMVWLSKNYNEFLSRGIKVISLSADKLVHHSKWLSDIKSNFDIDVNFPIIADKSLRIIKLYNMLNGSSKSKTTNSDNIISRFMYLISPSKKVVSIFNYPVNTGRNFHEVLRLIDSLMLTDDKNLATPVNWQNGDDLVIASRDTEKETALGYPVPVQAKSNTLVDSVDFNLLTTEIAC